MLRENYLTEAILRKNGLTQYEETLEHNYCLMVIFQLCLSDVCTLG